jgi:hypothetical protein
MKFHRSKFKKGSSRKEVQERKFKKGNSRKEIQECKFMNKDI